MSSLANEAQLNKALNLPEDGCIEDAYFSWTDSDHHNINTTQSVEDTNNACQNLTIQIPTSLLQRTYLEENSQPCTPQPGAYREGGCDTPHFSLIWSVFPGSSVKLID